MQVFHSSRAASTANVCIGDILFAADGQSLPHRTNALELEETLNPREEEDLEPRATFVNLSLWRTNAEAFLGIGKELARLSAFLGDPKSRREGGDASRLAATREVRGP